MRCEVFNSVNIRENASSCKRKRAGRTRINSRKLIMRIRRTLSDVIEVRRILYRTGYIFQRVGHQPLRHESGIIHRERRADTPCAGRRTAETGVVSRMPQDNHDPMMPLTTGVKTIPQERCPDGAILVLRQDSEGRQRQRRNTAFGSLDVTAAEQDMAGYLVIQHGDQ